MGGGVGGYAKKTDLCTDIRMMLLDIWSQKTEFLFFFSAGQFYEVFISVLHCHNKRQDLSFICHSLSYQRIAG